MTKDDDLWAQGAAFTKQYLEYCNRPYPRVERYYFCIWFAGGAGKVLAIPDGAEVCIFGKPVAVGATFKAGDVIRAIASGIADSYRSPGPD